MGAIIMRSALVYFGHDPTPEVHSVVIDHRGRHVVTWADVMRRRCRRQADRLARKRHVVPVRAYRLWVAYFDQELFGGWHAFLEDFRGRPSRIWIDRNRSRLIPELMRLFPPATDWEGWKSGFARACQRGTHDGYPRGCAYVWWDGKGSPTPVR